MRCPVPYPWLQLQRAAARFRQACCSCFLSAHRCTRGSALRQLPAGRRKAADALRYDNSGGACTVLCGSKVLSQSFRSENVNLLQDTVTGETNYWFRTWADPDAYCGRRSGLCDKDGNEVMTFEGEQNASMQNGLLVLQEAHAVNGSYENGYDDYGTCQVIDLSTGERLPVPDGAYRCIVCGDRLVFTCYARPADLA